MQHLTSFKLVMCAQKCDRSQEKRTQKEQKIVKSSSLDQQRVLAPVPHTLDTGNTRLNLQSGWCKNPYLHDLLLQLGNFPLSSVCLHL